MMKIKRNTTDLYGIIFVVCGNRVNSFVSTYTHCVFSSMEEKNKSTKWDVWLLSCELLLLYLPSSSTVPTYQFNFIIHIFNINGWMVCDAHCEIGMLLIQFIYILIIEKKKLLLSLKTNILECAIFRFSKWSYCCCCCWLQIRRYENINAICNLVDSELYMDWNWF